jgi:hypothetical protein
MSLDIDELKTVKSSTIQAKTFSSLFNKDDSTPRESKRLKGTNENVDTPKIKKKRFEAKIDTLTVFMGTDDIDSDWVVVQPLKWLYVSMLHPETIEHSNVKLLGRKLNNAENGITFVKLVYSRISRL